MSVLEMVSHLSREYAKLGATQPLMEFVLKNHDGEMRGGKLPRKREYGTTKECFANAGRLALESSLYVYHEGFALRAGLLPVHHAWTVYKGRVVDTTWRDSAQCTYIGVAFTREELRDQLLKSKAWGLLDGGLEQREFLINRGAAA